jgi:hypothetical protein
VTSAVEVGPRVMGPVEVGRSVQIGYKSRELVGVAASMFAGYRQPERAITVGPSALFRADGSLRPSGAKAIELGHVVGWADREEVEGPRWRIEISPGSVRIGATDPVKRDRALARANVAAGVKERQRLEREAFDPCWDGCLRARCQGCRRYDLPPGAKIRSFSRSSRRGMTHRLATLDYAPLFVNFFGAQTVPAMVTVTYPGDWVTVAPSNRVVRRHVEQLRKRWDRAYSDHGFPLVGVWKREFQERGAPHYHLLCVPPAVSGFRQWLSETWADIVQADSCGARCWETGDGRVVKGLACCERGRHVVSGTGVDYREGARATDPRRLAIYFSKHGGYAAKEYQNDAPGEWVDRGGVGRFWGVWGLRPAVAVVGLAPDVALALARVLRGLERTRRYRLPVRVLRCTRPEADPSTGEQLHAHTRGCFRSSGIVVQHFKGSAGFVVVNDGPALAADLARVADLVPERPRRLYRTSSGRVWRGTSGGGPVGFLPG